MTLQERFMDQLGKNYAQGLAILRAKNHDYTANSTVDPFANFRNSAAFADVEVEQGIRVRIADKLSRLKALLGTDFIPAVDDEKLSDTLLDLINYFNIMKAWFDMGMPDPEEVPVEMEPPVPVEEPTPAKSISQKVVAIFGR